MSTSPNIIKGMNLTDSGFHKNIDLQEGRQNGRWIGVLISALKNIPISVARQLR